MENASDRFKPLWQSSQINHQKLDLFCAGRANQRAYFSLCRAGSTACDLALEYHPVQGWLAPGSNAAACYTTFGLDTEQLYAGSPTVTGQVYQQLATGADDGAAIPWRFQTRWFELNAGFNADSVADQGSRPRRRNDDRSARLPVGCRRQPKLQPGRAARNL
jgi:hypothetical protein